MTLLRTDGKELYYSEATGARLGSLIPHVAQNAHIPIVIVISADDVFPDINAQREFNLQNVTKEQLTEAAVFFLDSLRKISPNLSQLGNIWRQIIIEKVLEDSPSALPMGNTGDPLQAGFIILGTHHATGRNLAEKMTGVPLPQNAYIPTHASLETQVLFHELDHLRPGIIGDKPQSKAEGLHDETARDSFSLKTTQDLVTAQDRRAFIDYRVLNGVHTSDETHRTALGLTLLENPETTDRETWESLMLLGQDIYDSVRPDKFKDMRKLFGEAGGLLLDRLHPLSYDEGYNRVREVLQDSPHNKDARFVTMMQAYMAAHDRIRQGYDPAFHAAARLESNYAPT